MEKTQESHPSNPDIFEGRWKQMRGELRSWWGRLTDGDLEQIGGQHDKLIGTLQECYGYSRERAQQEVERRLREYHARLGAASPTETPREGTAGRAASTVAEKLETAGSYRQGKKVEHVAGDVTDLMRRYPLAALLIGLGIGYFLACTTRR
jgi:uncharacterized protein YjbJ (UPF0337 family)